MSKPPYSTCPDEGSSRPASILAVVVFPEPLGPRYPTTWPGLMVKSTSFTTRTPEKCFDSLCARRLTMARLQSTGRARRRAGQKHTITGPSDITRTTEATAKNKPADEGRKSKQISIRNR